MFKVYAQTRSGGSTVTRANSFVQNSAARALRTVRGNVTGAGRPRA